MDKPELDNVISTVDDSCVLNRSRSFKSKQLVRSQALREAPSPPRTASPAVSGAEWAADATPAAEETADDNATSNFETSDSSTHIDKSDDGGVSYVTNNDINDCKMKQQPVEIQITSGNWDLESQSDQRQRTKRWLGQRDLSEPSPDLLSNNPRVACVCGNCAACPHCRGRRRKNYCPTKQDSGIVCSDECPDCSDGEASGSNNEGMHKSASLDADDQNYYCRCPEKRDKSKNSVLTRTDSDDKSEPTGPELVNFIKETLNKNPKDRIALLKIERELYALVNDTGRCIVRFPVMTSYGRMLVHRCASLFQLSHHLDQASKTCVMVSKSGTSGGRIPCTSFRQWCTVKFPPSPQRYQPDSTHTRYILKRDAHSLDEPSGGSMPSNRSKSLEQREREYERVRRRIFSTDNCSRDESQWPWMSGPIRLLTSDAGRSKLLKVQSLEGTSPATGAGCQARGAVSKSHSFSGRAPDTPSTRLLSRHGDLASSSWRLSPSSSGYKTLSLRSTDSVTPSPTGGASPEPTLAGVGTESVVWAISKLSSVPAGAVVLHPQNGRPLMNPDGSLYHFDPANPPVLYDLGYRQDDYKIDNSEKKRGRLEKQHSFIDNDCECQLADECRSKCCQDYRRHEPCQPKTTIDKETNTKEESPTESENGASQNGAQELTNHSAPPDHEAAAFEPPANRNEAEDARAHEPANHTTEYERQNVQRADEIHRSFETVKEPTNHQPANGERQLNLSNQESQELQHYHQHHAYAQGYAADEVTSAAQAAGQYMHPDLTAAMHPKVAPVAVPDPNIRPVSLTNMLYPGAMPQPYPYVNQCQVNPGVQPAMYQGMMPAEEINKLAPSPHAATDNTFRIDPSYPYGTIEYGAPCGACVDSNSLQYPHRSYSVPYNQMEMQPVLQPTYPMGNVLLPQSHLQHYPYQEPVQWASVQPGMPATPKLLVSDVYPFVQYPTKYPQYNLMYQQLVPQPYPVLQPVYPLVEKQQEPPARGGYRPRPKHDSSSHTPQQTPPDAGVRRDPPPPRRPDNSEIVVKIQQIKEQMEQLNTKDTEKERKKEEWKKEDWKRRSNNGILGSHPSNNYHERSYGRTVNDDSRLSNEARVIVNSIRNMQSKSTYHNDGRAPGPRSPRGRGAASRDDPHHQQQQPRHSGPEWQHGGRSRPVHPLTSRVSIPPYWFRQTSPNTWCRRSPGPVHPVLNNPRRPHPDSRNVGRR